MTAIALPIIAPLAAALTILLVRTRPAALAATGTAAGLLASFSLLAAVGGGGPSEVQGPGLPAMPLRLAGDPLTASLSLLVSIVAFFVMIYATGYMRRDSERVRFFATIMLFVAAMQALVLAGDWITLLAAWELIGSCSYMLIGFWHRRPGVAAAAIRAFLYTRSADLGLYIGVFTLIGAAGSSQISATLSVTGAPALAAGLALLVGAIGKSAQVPLQDWLQRAMAGPTPVSALLHSATLVAAGAILLIRTAPLLPDGALLAIGLAGGATAVLTGLIALAQSDLKRLLAASTSSQYGLMLLAVGAGAPVAALLHLIAHAAIKSSLFLGAGVFQHDRETTSIEGLAGAGRARPLIYAGFVVSALALAGIPPLSGFFSKDAIIASALASPGAPWLAPLAIAATALTGAYMARAMRALVSGAANSAPTRRDTTMGIGVIGLALLAAALGVVFPALERFVGTEIEAPLSAAALGLAAGAGGLALGWFVPVRRLMGPLAPWARRGFAVAGGFDGFVLRPAFAIAKACDRIDQRIYQSVLAIGRSARSAAAATERLERALYEKDLAIGPGNLRIGVWTRITDEKGVDGVIDLLVRGAIVAGGQARRLQSGLIHRELALTTIAVALLALALIAFSLFA